MNSSCWICREGTMYLQRHHHQLRVDQGPLHEEAAKVAVINPSGFGVTASSHGAQRGARMNSLTKSTFKGSISTFRLQNVLCNATKFCKHCGLIPQKSPHGPILYSFGGICVQAPSCGLQSLINEARTVPLVGLLGGKSLASHQSMNRLLRQKASLFSTSGIANGSYLQIRRLQRPTDLSRWLMEVV